MADAIPANLRQPDIVRFLSRADQLRAFKPAMAYWCEYSAVLRIMKAGLHNSDDECYAFATGLMDRLETIKTEHAADSTVADDTVGRAFVHQFAQDTLDRADRTMRANKVSRTTADTYDAAATFFLVTTIWGDPDPETGNKIKYAKWHAARILRAIREGRDPNESNPPPPTAEPASPVLQALDPDDPEVRALTEGGGRPLPARVDDAPSDDDDSEVAGMLPPPYGRSPTAASSGPGPAPVLVSPTLSGPSMPDGLPDRPDRSRGGYGGGGGAAEEEYYDQVDTFAPSPMSQSPPPPPSLPSGPSSHLAPGPAPVHHAPSAPTPFDDPPERSPESFSSRTSRASRASGPRLPPAPVDLDPALPVTRHQPPPAPSWYAPPPPPLPPGPANYSYDEKDVAAAQKHAKWAISALNFDDVATAVKELRLALEVLRG